MTDVRYRFRGRVAPSALIKTPVRAEAPNADVTDGIAKLRLYDPIDSWGGFWGVSAREFAEALDQVGNVDQIHLHINSPGGEVWEGIAIKNALQRHPARVTAIVDGIAASAASFVAAAADEVVMGRNTEMMIHDAWGIGIGPAETMRELANRLDKVSDNIASIYADKAGGDVATWRGFMLAETWYSAEEAVAAGLADRVEGDEDDDAKNAFDLSMFRYGGRAAAPAPAPAAEHHDEPAPPRHLDHVERVMRGYAARYRLPLQ